MASPCVVLFLSSIPLKTCSIPSSLNKPCHCEFLRCPRTSTHLEPQKTQRGMKFRRNALSHLSFQRQRLSNPSLSHRESFSRVREARKKARAHLCLSHS